MAAPALFYSLFNWNDPVMMRGWAIPAATDIAFALAALSLAGSRVPLSLKVFLLTLATLDDLGAIKVRTDGGEPVYAIPDLPRDQRVPDDHLRRTLGEWVVEVKVLTDSCAIGFGGIGPEHVGDQVAREQADHRERGERDRQEHCDEPEQP